MSFVILDFETRGFVDLKTHGVYKYANDPLTEVMCAALFLENKDAPYIYIAEKFLVLINPDNIKYPIISENQAKQILSQSERVIAHNVKFEHTMENRILHPRRGWPVFNFEKMYDTMAQLAYHALPLNMEEAARVMGLRQQKDMVGHNAMLRCCKPRNPLKKEKEANPNWENMIFWDEKPKNLEDNFNYCCQDVIVTRKIYESLPKLPEKQYEVWLHTELKNERGLYVDIESINKIVNTVEAYKESRIKRFNEIVGSEINTPQSHVAIKNWVNKETGLNLTSVNKNAVNELLEGGVTLPSHVKEVLEIKSELGKSSVSKFTAIQNRVDTDSRIKGWSVFHGAATGRFSAMDIQLHNSPRDSYIPERYEQVLDLFGVETLTTLQAIWGDPFYVASRCIRGSICAAPGKKFYCVDFSSIEAVALAYLAGETWVLDAFRNGVDLYKLIASKTFGCTYDEVTKDQRQAGKVLFLAFGYAGGINACVQMASNYNFNLDTLKDLLLPTATQGELYGEWKAEYMAKIYMKQNPDTLSFETAIACDIAKQRWREDRPETKAFWKQIESAAKQAIETPGQIFGYRKIRFKKDGMFLKCQLPSGRILHYFRPYIKESEMNDETGFTSNQIHYSGMKVLKGTTARKWVTIKTYSGKLTENIVQGFCADLLTEMILRHEKNGFPIVLDVHDEDVAEVPENDNRFDDFKRLAEIVPVWAQGMPIRVTGWENTRYHKD